MQFWAFPSNPDFTILESLTLRQVWTSETVLYQPVYLFGGINGLSRNIYKQFYGNFICPFVLT